jgi:DHA1 family tetracycline resistance protein-like MFS transporter
MNKRQLTLLFSVVFMDMIGFGFIIPIMPDIIKQFGSSQEMLGVVLGIYALGQFIAAPIVGSLSDKYGRKPLLLLSIGGTFISLILLGVARSIVMVLISRFLDGITGGNITVAQSYIADSTSKEDRSKGFGLIGMAFGLGFIFGPLFGGLLMNISIQAPPLVAAGIAAINLVVIAFVLPESHPKEKRNSIRKIRIIDIDAFRQVLSQDSSRKFLSIIFFYTLAFNTFETMFSSHSMMAVGLTPQARGLILAYMGVLIALMQGGIIGKLTKKFQEISLLNLSNLILVFSLFAWAFVTNIYQLIIIILPISFAAAIQSVIQKSLLSKSDEGDNQGMILGVSTSWRA